MNADEVTKLVELVAERLAAAQAKGKAIACYLAYRRDGGENYSGSGRISLAVTQSLLAGDPAAVAPPGDGAACAAASAAAAPMFPRFAMSVDFDDAALDGQHAAAAMCGRPLRSTLRQRCGMPDSPMVKDGAVAVLARRPPPL